MTELEILINKRKGMKQYKDKSPEELEAICKKDLERDEIKKSFIGFRDDEIDRAISIYYRYLDEGSLESLAEKSALISLVYMEILKERMQQLIAKEDADKNGAIPLHVAEKLIDLDTQIMEQKEKLGLLKDRDNASFLTTWEELKKKTLKYYQEHAGSTVVRCPYCQHLFHLLMNVDNLTPEKATFFRGTMLYNLPLLNLYHGKRLSKEEVAQILGVHTKYVDFIYQNLYLKELDKNEEMS